MTLPQIELMSADLPHTLYKHYERDKKGKKIRPTHGGVDDECRRLTEEANRKFEEKRRRKQEGYTASELLAGLAEKDKGEL